MIRAFLYLVQVGALTFAAAWVLQQGGRFDLTFGPYHVQGESGILALGILIGLFLLLMFHRVWLWFLHFPRTWKRYRRDVLLIKGHRALTRSLSALAYGDYGVAHTHARRAERCLPDFGAVPTILIATTAEKQGQAGQARAALQSLMKTEARDLGVRGLVNAALNEGNWDQGLAFARAALVETPRALMLQRLVYDLECQTGDFDAALNRQKGLVRRQGLSAPVARHDRVMMLTVLARRFAEKDQHKKARACARAAFDLDPGFVPAACELIDLYRGFGKTRRAMWALHRAFAACPHPDLIERHEQMMPQAKNLARRMRYHEKLLSLRPDDAGAQLLLARVALAEGMVGEARAYLVMAERLDPRQGVYRALADFAQSQGEAEAAREYLSRGMAARPDPVWHCRVTGRSFDRWEALVLPEHYFGTIVWGVPQEIKSTEEPVLGLLSSARSEGGG